MKQWIYLLILVLVGACSDKYQSILDAAPSQELSFSKDSVQIREKDYSNILYSTNGQLTLYCKDVIHQLNLVRDDTSTSVHLLYRGEDIVPGKSLPVADSLQVFISADRPGMYQLRFYLTDRLGRVISQQLPVRVLTNQPATPDFFYRMEAQAQLQSWPFQFNASLSHKPDGIITRYHYSINGQAIDSRDPVIRWIFRSKGEHVVGLSVTDDLGQPSATVYKKIMIQ